MSYTHLSLFSGIGGLDLAAEAAGFVTVGQIEYADFPRKVLEKNFPDVERWRDVRQFTVDDFRQRTGYSTVDILSGGFPCQPHSLAGKRLASRDERDLWGEMRRIICELRPRWVVAENVLGLLSSEHGRFFAGVLRDLSDLGYNKSQEVVEKNYKPFFIERWLENGLISQYDAYVYRCAYELHSYRTGLLVGRMRWYIEHGKDGELRERFQQDLDTGYVNSDNNEFLEKELSSVLPPVTLIMNVEFQTKRRFYASVGEQFLRGMVYRYDGDPALEKLMKLVSLSPEFLEYLTRETICFVADRNDEDGKGKDRVMCDWWRRIHSCRIPFTDKVTLDLWREYDRKTDIVRSRSLLQSAIARYSIISRQSLDSRSFAEDVSDVLCSLNDNDFYGFATDKDGMPVRLVSHGYDTIQRRKARQYRGVIKPKAAEEEPPKTEVVEDDELPY